ncbi:hypothetical protein C2G38_2186190 [Gigaspora rosea]|uniref:Uncharacterized protein n=1 Tax=Gigaspora rosea TaxID=44941 RepID=A0A397VCY4_9GLOM|nr:hypothetical protein C2G38_2186190 [Gigaspora rosea]
MITGYAKYPNLAFNSEDFTSLKDDDGANFLLPYSQIIDKNIWNDLIKKFMTSNYNYQISSTILPLRIISEIVLPEPFSTIINEEYAAEIASDAFWNLCDMKSNTVIVSNVKGSYNIENFLEDIIQLHEIILLTIMFIARRDYFSLKNDASQNSILSRVKNPQYALFLRKNYYVANFAVMIFECLMILIKFVKDQNACRCDNDAYETEINNVEISLVNEYEIFQIH